MGKLTEGLKKYLKETPREKVLEDWEKTKHLDNVGITVCNYFKYVNSMCGCINREKTTAGDRCINCGKLFPVEY